MTRVTEFKLRGRTLRAGDLVKVKRSTSGLPGFEGKVQTALIRDGAVVEVTVFGGPNGRHGSRTVTPDRIHIYNAATVAKKRGDS